MFSNKKVQGFYVIIFVLFCYLVNAQNPSVLQAPTTVTDAPCAVTLPANYLAWKKTIVPGGNQTQNMQNNVTTLKHDTCLDKKFSIVFYLIQDSIYSITPITLPVITASLITPAMNRLNDAFKRICVSFENCSTVVIPNYPYNIWSQTPLEPIITANWYTPQTINFYIPTTCLVNNGANQGGYTYMPGTPGRSDIIVMRENAVGTSYLMHLIGHYFGLPDTYAEINPGPVMPAPPPGVTSMEFVERINCSTRGDGFCDTEADPFPVNYNPSGPIPPPQPCHFDYGLMDGQGKYYLPPVDNFMSEYRGTCRCRYTQEQYNFMARVILTQKLYLH